MGRKITLMRLKSALTAWSRQLTWPWITAFAMLAASAGFYLSVVMPARHTLEEIHSHLSMMKHDEQRLKQASQGAARRAPTGQLDAFYEAFPAENSVTDTIEKMIKIAQAKELNPKQAEYRITRNNPGDLLSYQITLPIKGAYPKIMDFAFELLSSIPNVSLDNVSFQRQKVGDSDVEAMLWLTLYIKRGRSVEH